MTTKKIYFLSEQLLEKAPWGEIQELLNVCFPRPPQDVYARILASSHCRQRLWIARHADQMVGMIMLSPHSKGGHLENLAVVPQARGLGLGSMLVNEVLSDVSNYGPGIISLTTRIPTFFSQFGFQSCGYLSDHSVAMYFLMVGSNGDN